MVLRKRKLEDKSQNNDAATLAAVAILCSVLEAPKKIPF